MDSSEPEGNRHSQRSCSYNRISITMYHILVLYLARFEVLLARAAILLPQRSTPRRRRRRPVEKTATQAYARRRSLRNSSIDPFCRSRNPEVESGTKVSVIHVLEYLFAEFAREETSERLAERLKWVESTAVHHQLDRALLRLCTARRSS